MKNLSEKFATFSQDFKNVHQEAKKQGFVNIMKLLWKDLFVGRTAFQWIYLLLLSSVPFFLEWTNRTGQHDWLGLFASWTGIVCVILVAEGRASNYLFGAVNSAIYLVLALNKNFYGEVLTTLYFFIMQPIGSYVNDGFRDMTMADEEIRTSFSNYLDQLRQQYLGNIPTTFLASDYLGNYEEAKKVIDAIYQAD